MSDSGAVIEGEYRYVLWRTLAPLQGELLSGRLLWVMLNPSVASATVWDPTVRKVVGFSRRWGFAQARIVNLFALRSTDPGALKTHAAPVGPKNDDWIWREVREADAIVYAWGGNADPKTALARARATEVQRLIWSTDECDGTPVWTLGLTKGGQPRHPLMLGYSTIRAEAE